MGDVQHERRNNDSQIDFLTSILQSVQRLHDKIDTLEAVKASLRDLDRKIDDHIKDETSLCKAAFPDGDAVEHRKYHSALIKKAEQEADLAMEAKKKVMTWGLGAALFAVAVVFVFYWNSHMPASAHITLSVPK